ncbi:hypothetical protein STVIR_0453 [Streptomyces viridochromogenes Tue57]|uniref:Uncharacterized protein n=1 Tax=Streptomyces viridochromogenes Tue57 TaxID=1160705 RepID=L8PT13_STRVR|nr:hypothetical protein STVIR_0453 [Streptomyces viridochromogenes Tue57]
MVGLAGAGRADLDNRLVSDGTQPIGLGRHLTSSDLAVDVTENRQSECPQF